MATYQISRVSEEDILQIAEMSASSTYADPLLNTIIQDTGGVSSRSWELCRDLAKHNYSRGLDDSTDLFACSLVLKSCFHFEPHVIEASAWIQHFYPDPDYWHIQWKEERSNFDESPSSVDEDLHRHIENVLHTDRKVFMQGREHYCSSLEPFVLTKW